MNDKYEAGVHVGYLGYMTDHKLFVYDARYMPFVFFTSNDHILAS